jgi:hypothetical protein
MRPIWLIGGSCAYQEGGVLMLGRAAIILAVMLKFVVNASTASQPSIHVFPRDLHGIWFSDESDGRTQCRAFLKASKSNDDPAFDLLVGSELIRGDLWHSVAEYGEGSFYKLRQLTKIGVQNWQVEADVGIDSHPDPLENQRANFEVKIANRKLLWTENSLNSQFAPKGKTHRFFRCSAVPASFARK